MPSQPQGLLGKKWPVPIGTSLISYSAEVASCYMCGKIKRLRTDMNEQRDLCGHSSLPVRLRILRMSSRRKYTRRSGKIKNNFLGNARAWTRSYSEGRCTDMVSLNRRNRLLRRLEDARGYDGQYVSPWGHTRIGLTRGLRRGVQERPAKP